MNHLVIVIFFLWYKPFDSAHIIDVAKSFTTFEHGVIYVEPFPQRSLKL